jgi:hypothetical protein
MTQRQTLSLKPLRYRLPLVQHDVVLVETAEHGRDGGRLAVVDDRTEPGRQEGLLERVETGEVSRRDVVEIGLALRELEGGDTGHGAE